MQVFFMAFFGEYSLRIYHRGGHLEGTSSVRQAAVLDAGDAVMVLLPRRRICLCGCLLCSPSQAVVVVVVVVVVSYASIESETG